MLGWRQNAVNSRLDRKCIVCDYRVKNWRRLLEALSIPHLQQLTLDLRHSTHGLNAVTALDPTLFTKSYNEIRMKNV